MIQTIRVKRTDGKDLLGLGVLLEIHKRLKNREVTNVETARIYRLEGISQNQAKVLAEKLFCESINHTYSFNKPLLNNKTQVVEIAYKKGVMNPEVFSILKSAKDLGITLTAADSSTEYGFSGITKEKAKKIAKDLRLYNSMTQEIVEKPPHTLQITGKPGKTEIIKIRKMNDEELMQLSYDKLFLNLEEMKVIQNYFQKLNRDPIDCEVETLAQTWSEHSGHKTFKANLIVDGKKKLPLFSRLKKEALKHDKNIVSAFVDNSGVMNFYDGYAICGKGETHNSPSAIEPYGGTMTGNGGVFRDILGTGLGAKTLASADIFCLAAPNMDLKKLPPGCLPPDYMLTRVVAAVRDYDNRVGIPTNNGSFHFHDDFRAKPTVLAGAYGIMPLKKAKIGKPKKGDRIIIIGGRTGRDGIHGATFSSGEMTDKTASTNTHAVQIGNAIEEKRAIDAILEARDKDCIHALQDVGGGGFSSAVGEMGKETGVLVQLKNVKLKYQGLSPWEIWLSESQERMMAVVPKTKVKLFSQICKKYNVEMQDIGVFDGSKKLQVFFGKEKVCDLSMEFLHNGLPQRTMKATNNKQQVKRKEKVSEPKNQNEWIQAIKKVLSHPNVCSKEPIVRLYDHTVQGTSVLQPFSGQKMDGPNDAAVIRPLLGKPYGMIISHGLNPILNRIDPYYGSLWAGVEALSNYVAVGGDHQNASLINNYIWPFPDEESLWSLDKSVDAVIDIMKTFKTPVISGKDSLSSTYRGKNGFVLKIPPVLCISVFGKIPNVLKTVSSDIKGENSILVLLGKPDFGNMGGSIYFDVNNLVENSLPKVDLKNLPKLFSTIYKEVQRGHVLSAHDISEGGIITALFEMCVGGNVGATIDVSKIAKERPDFILFNETAGTFLVELENDSVTKQLFKNIPHVIIGKTKKQKTVKVMNKKAVLFDANLEELKNAWQKPMKKYFN